MLPVRDQSPILAWSPWTVAQMLEKKTRYDLENHVKELSAFIDTIIDPPALNNYPGWREDVEGHLRLMIKAVLDVPDAIRETSKKCCELERTGVVIFRY